MALLVGLSPSVPYPAGKIYDHGGSMDDLIFCAGVVAGVALLSLSSINCVLRVVRLQRHGSSGAPPSHHHHRRKSNEAP
jgi:hypothetical protein